MTTRHGTPGGYREDGCKCDLCRRAITKSANLYRMRRSANGGPLLIPKLGAVRRLQALMAMGWPRRELGAQAGYRSDVFAMLLYGDRAVVRPETHQRVCDLYDRLCMTPGPSSRAMSDAAKKGWPKPLAWDDIDDENEQPYAGTERSTYSAAELVAEWDWLRRAGESIDQAARQLGVTVGAIEKACERQGKKVA